MEHAVAEPTRPAFISSVIYKDNRAALKWLEQAFGFEISEVLVDSKDVIVHAEMRHGDGIVMIGNEWTDWTKSPASIGGKNTQRIHVHIAKDIDKHCEQARKAGAMITMEPADQFYGERTYVAQDLDGHHWTFSQTVKHATEADYGKAGFKTKKWE
jgi:uncharacterized glyoxalase superfamily protein PhnB